ncbi:C40 family peptidase [Pseudonocardia endophytica]|uniref:Cell wall-associated NlpC family hydrolase n=1 Tax=Pseudonocardia endophytica TaxID=401976 RepID=A0A4R1HRB6_PSEEN|nr:NlpC/P60 family protein [Pseudonocardia endophytica]TCK25127.1 cell wall-associated NlpC family hydrolase [Pseudonocardia endophytica]
MTIAPEVATRARHSTDGEGISAADLLARFADAGFDRPTRSGRRSAERAHEAVAEPYGAADTVVTRDVPAGLSGDVPSAGLIRGRTSETGAFGRNPRAVAATMGATLVGATAVMGVVTALDSPDEAAADLQTRPVDLAGSEQATMKLQSVPSAASKLGGATAGTPAGFDQADAAKIASNNLAAAKKAADAKSAADRKAAAPAASGGGDQKADLSGLGSLGMKALEMAKSKLGKPYVWGADGPNAFDCSGLMKWAFEQVGKDLPRSSSAQSQVGTPVSKSDLQPGDVVFFYSPVSHVGIYAGNGKILHASEPGEPVKYSDMDRMPFHNAVRL